MSKNKPVIIDDLFGELEIPEEPKRWVVIHTRPRQEKKLANYCRKYGIHYYLPLREKRRVYGRKKVMTQIPLFSGYVFTILNHAQKETIKLSGAVANFIAVDYQEELMQDLAAVRRVVQEEPEIKQTDWLSKGLEVELIDGPFKGMRGVVQSQKKLDVVHIQVNILRQSLDVEYNPAHVKIIGEFDTDKEKQ
ncbi:MAG TPA: hypothetical protein GXX77_06860 [Candidatus Cloacimonetes bacterium]|nr:hypothetical protein [Candidatus Cloacimonadota bacterium]